MKVMEKIRTTELKHHLGEEVSLECWLHSRRNLGKLVFSVIRDGWGLCQVVSQDPDGPPNVPGESLVRVSGTVVEAPTAPGGVEIHSSSWVLIGSAEMSPINLGKKELKVSPSTLLDYGAISLRHPSRRRVFHVSSSVARGFRHSLDELGFTEIQTPKIISGAVEGGANVFQLDYFGTPAFLAQSPQLYKQMMVGVFERVYEVGPVFRSEPHDTSRHLNQYTSLDAELGFIESHRDVMDVVTRVIHDMLEAASEAAKTRPLEVGEIRMPLFPDVIPSISFWDAGEVILQQFGRDMREENDLSPQDERDLCRWAREEYGSDFLFVTGYPMSKRPFYTHPDPENPSYSNSFDLLFRGLEIVTGGQRLHRYEDYLESMAERTIDMSPFRSYLMAFQYGMPPHGGFAIGLERFVAQLLEIENVRETTLFPRTMNRLQP